MIGEGLREQLGCITPEDIASLEAPTLSIDQFTHDLRTTNLALWNYMRTALEKIAPQDPATKGQIAGLIGNILLISESAANRRTAENLFRIPNTVHPQDTA